jgi:hypothetical protein
MALAKFSIELEDDKNGGLSIRTDFRLEKSNPDYPNSEAERIGRIMESTINALVDRARDKSDKETTQFP